MGWSFSNADNIQQLLGASRSTLGISGGWFAGGGFQKTFSLDSRGSYMLNSEGENIFEISASHPPFPGVNFGAETHLESDYETTDVFTFGKERTLEDISD